MVSPKAPVRLVFDPSKSSPVRTMSRVNNSGIDVWGEKATNSIGKGPAEGGGRTDIPGGKNFVAGLAEHLPQQCGTFVLANNILPHQEVNQFIEDLPVAKDG